VQAVLRRYRMPLLRYLDQNTDLVVRRTVPGRDEHPAPGDLVHVDIKTRGRIPDGGGHRKLGRTIGNRHNKKRGRGYALVHHAVGDHSRRAYSEILGDECTETAAAFWGRGPRPTSPTRPAQRPTQNGSITTISIDPALASAASYPSNASAFITCP